MNINPVRIPPQSPEAEQSVIGGLLLGGEKAWDKVSDVLREDDFYVNANRRVFAHIRKLAEAGKPVDVVTVSDSIDAANESYETGGLSYVGGIVQSTPGAANIAFYANIVAEKAMLRRLIVASDDIAEIAYRAGNDPVLGRIDEAAGLMMALTERDGIKNEPVAVGDILGAVIEQIDMRFHANGEISGLETGFADVDAKLDGLQPGDLIIIAGRPSMGKTAFALNIGENVAQADKPVLVFSMEMGKEQLVTRSLSSLGGIDSMRLRSGRLDDDEWQRLTVATSKLHKIPLIIDDTPGLSAAQMHSRARRQLRKSGLSLVVIDYLQLMNGKGDNRSEELSGITRALKQMARDLHVPVICLSQLSRNVESRPNKRPVMSDLRESGAIEQDADVIMMLYRDEYYNPDSPYKGIAEVLIRKARMGAIGDVRMVFQPEFTRFRDVDREAISGMDDAAQKKPVRNRGFEG